MNHHDGLGRKEVEEAVLIAALSAAISGLVNWGIERLKKHIHGETNEEAIYVEYEGLQ